jgi:hypothetical protein
MSRVVTGGDVVRLRKEVLAVGAATVTRAREGNIATVEVTAHGLSVGDEVVVASLGGTGYNGTVTVLTAPTTTSFTYANVGADETSAADTAGRVGACRGIAHVVGIYY